MNFLYSRILDMIKGYKLVMKVITYSILIMVLEKGWLSRIVEKEDICKQISNLIASLHFTSFCQTHYHLQKGKGQGRVLCK